MEVYEFTDVSRTMMIDNLIDMLHNILRNS